MAFELPVVASSVHGIPELVREGRDAHLVPAGDEYALAATIEQVLDDPRSAAAIAASARRRIEAHFSIDGVVDRYRSLFDELLVEAEAGE